MNFKKIKKDDTVEVIAGKEKGKSSKVIDINRDKGRVMLDGLNLVKKAMKRSNQNQAGGIKDIEAFVDISNVMLICPKCKKSTRVGFRIDEKTAEKTRFCKKCNSTID